MAVGGTRMGDSGTVELVVQCDDFGMCHAVNEGAVRAFVDGIVTQTSAMVPCPWFSEAAELAQRHGIPTGIHCTLTCEWDYLRWSPLTGAASLTGADRTFHRTVADAQTASDPDEAAAELVAQTERFLGTGLTPTHFDCHMGLISVPAYEAVCRQFKQRFIYPGVTPSYTFTSIKGLSQRPADEKKPWLLSWLDRLTPGVHLLVTHCAVPGIEMAAITGPDSVPFLWAEEYRKSDLATLTDPDVRKAVDDLGIQLRSVADSSALAAGDLIEA